TVYLDFNGHGTRQSIRLLRHTSPGFQLDQHAGINPTEAAMIEDIWSTVAEDFAAFDVNVTTHKPESGQFDRVAIGGLIPGWNGNSPGIHRSYDNDTSWVWPEGFGRFPNTFEDLGVQIGNAASHEQGHELGLDHKSERFLMTFNRSVFESPVSCEITWETVFDPHGGSHGTTERRPVLPSGWQLAKREYSSGDPNWNPIMGTAYDSQRTIWTQAVMHLEDRRVGSGERFRGEKCIHTTGDNEVTYLQRELGLRADDHGDSVDAATLMTSSIAVGNIETASDTDVFVLDVSPGGTFSVDVDVAEVAPNLDLELSVFELSESGDLRARQTRIEPIDRLGASSSLLTLTPSADRIVIMVSSRGVFAGDIGTYTVRTTFMPAPRPRRLTRAIATPVSGTSFAPLASRSMSYTAMPAASDQGLRSTSSFTQKATPAFSLPQADAEPVSLSVDNLTKPKPQQPSVTAKGTPEPDMLQGLAIEKAFVDFEVQLEPVFNKV
ncbi:MAG: hypothetical protein ABGZ17_00355, partial [Planctomycetaceae bacterium]